jgi:hypothetical protein
MQAGPATGLVVCWARENSQLIKSRLVHFNSAADLEAAIHDDLIRFNANLKSFAWTMTSDASPARKGQAPEPQWRILSVRHREH